MNAPARPLLRYLGSKWRAAPWIISLLPRHHAYLEGFGGSAALLLRKPPVTYETYNDLDEELVNLFRVLRSPDAGELVRRVRLTPYARAEYLDAFSPSDDPVERARRTIIRSHFSHGNMSLRRARPSGFRVDGMTGKTNVARNWHAFPDQLEAIIARLGCVTLQQKPTTELIEDFDDPGVLIYLDPPYPLDTRSREAAWRSDSAPRYRHEMNDDEHGALIERCLTSRAMIAISGYPSPLYDTALAGWRRYEMPARAHRNSPRTEVLWMNRAAMAAREAGPLFDSTATPNNG